MQTLLDLFERVRQRDRAEVLRARRGTGFEPVSAAELVARVDRCARGLAAHGVGRGDRVGLICDNRPEWHVVDFACHRLGAVLVPLFSTLTPARVGYSLGDAGCRVVVVEDGQQLEKVQEVRDGLPELELVVVIDGAGGGEVPRAISLEELCSRGEDGGRVGSGGDGRSADLQGPEGPDALATIIYTSGTTGEPKGVMLSHGNLTSNVEAVLRRLHFGGADRAVSLLPLCHVFERTVDYAYLTGEAVIYYSSPERLADDLGLARPTVMIGVPRLFEKLRDRVESEVGRSGALRRRLFEWALRLGHKRARYEHGEGPFGPGDRLLHAVADALVLSRVRGRIAPELRFLCSGGAALDPGLNWWYESLGIALVQGYGLTESAPIISVNPMEDNRIGTVGPPLDNVEVRIADDGEILTRGPHVMMGYWNRPDATAEAIEDGWLHTGDVGRIDDGYLIVTDRKKAIIVTSTGKNVAPQPVENALQQSRYIERVAMVGDDRKFVAGLVVPNFEALQAWARGEGLEAGRRELCEDPRVLQLYERELERLQRDFASYERVRAFHLLSEPFTIEEGTLTPTLKTVRRRIEEVYGEEIEQMYRDAEAARRGGPEEEDR